MACLVTEDQAKVAIKMLNKIKHTKQTNNLNNSTQGKDKR